MAYSTSTDPMIQIEGVGKHYQARKGTRNVVLEDVNLDVRQGEFVSVVGVSGCGKTTLLRMVAGLAPYYPGTIRVRGEIVRGIPPRVGFVFQNSALLPWRNVRENVELGLNEVRRTLSRSEREEMVEHQVRLMGLDGYGDYLPAKLSGGMQQRAGLARALVAEPDVLLMDEPFGEAVFLADRVAVMSINPGKITQIVDIEVPRPRERHADGEAGRRIAELREHVLSLVLGSDARSDGSLEQRKAVRL
jgi:NitT/TauT family transport system ATP-binding protein